MSPLAALAVSGLIALWGHAGALDAITSEEARSVHQQRSVGE